MPEPLRLQVQRPPAKRRRKEPAEFNIPDALAFADEIFAGPCAGHEPRVAGRGSLVQRFVLPLELCKTTNALLSMMQSRPKDPNRRFTPAAQAKALEKKVFDKMWLQHPHVRPEPLGGRPMLRIVRFSSVEPDDGADGMKLVRDLLRPPRPPKWDAHRNRMTQGRKGFNFIADDAQRCIRTVRWWEKVPPGKGFGLLEIWTGGT